MASLTVLVWLCMRPAAGAPAGRDPSGSEMSRTARIRPGKGTKYRATIVGPGLTPDASWGGPAPPPYEAAAEAAAELDQRKSFADPACVATQATRSG